MEKGTAYYLDTNVLIYATVNDDTLGHKCRSILASINSIKIDGFTSCLTIDEFLWSLKKISPNTYISESENMLNLNIKFINVDKNILYEALEIIKEFNLKPRDAIHAATMKMNNIKVIISEDSDFDKVNWIRRRSIMEFKL